MECAQCANEVFYLSRVSGEPSFYFTMRGLAHPLPSAEFGAELKADPLIWISTSQRPA
jgi:hypothetical protein